MTSDDADRPEEGDDAERPASGGERGGEHLDADRLDEDAAWAAIVAGYGDRVLDDPPESTTSDGAVDGDPAAPSTDASGGPATGTGVGSIFDRPSYDARSAWRRDDAQARRPPEHEDHADSAGAHDPGDRYVPPEAPPLPRPRGVRGVAWVGLCGVPVLFLVMTVAEIRLVSGAGLLLVLWFVAGFGYLVGTMRDGSDDGWDDGARV